jgi:nitrogen fixation/metabolism regulation signal transduction histidine kinase
MVLVPVIFLAIYYLFAMGRIVDRIVNVDAASATLAEQASTQMLEARRAERNYFLLHDAASLSANQAGLQGVRGTVSAIGELEPQEMDMVQDGLRLVDVYQQQFSAAIATVGQPGQTPGERIQEVVKAYERDLNNLLKRSSRETRAQLIDDLRDRIGSFDSQITETVQTGNPGLRQVTSGLQASSEAVIQLATNLRQQNWQRVQADHRDARELIHRAEWVLTIVSVFTLVLSVWASLILPRQVVEPLVQLKEAVDHAAKGNYDIEFELHGSGEVVELAKSLQNLTAHFRNT